MGPFQYATVGLAIALLLALGALHIARADLGVVQAKYDGFVQTTEANGRTAVAEAKLKEKTNEEAITTANTGRADALGRLRISEAALSAAGRRLPSSPAAPAGSSQICFESATYNAAFSKYRDRLIASMERLGQLVVEGDEAQIDAKSLLQSWPK